MVNGRRAFEGAAGDFGKKVPGHAQAQSTSHLVLERLEEF
jgi:hypothetical protein